MAENAQFASVVDIDHLALYHDKAKQAFAPKGEFDEYRGKVDGLETTGGQPNVVEAVRVNGSPLSPDASKAVDIAVPTDNAQLANGAGYQTAADVAAAIAGKADASGLGTAAAANTGSAVADDANLPTGAAVKSFVEGKGYQTSAQVEAAIAGKGYQTAADVASAINTAVASAMDYKGAKASVADLPSSGNRTGDVWHVAATAASTPGTGRSGRSWA